MIQKLVVCITLTNNEEISLKDGFGIGSNMTQDNDNKTMYYAMGVSFASVILYLLILAVAPYLGDRQDLIHQ